MTAPDERLFGALADLHKRNGSPSARHLVATIGRRRISHDTVNKAIRGHSIISWRKLSLIVTALNGDAVQFETLWRATRTDGPSSAPDASAAEVIADPAPPAASENGHVIASEAPSASHAEDDPAGRTPVNLSFAAFAKMLANYRPDRAEDIRRITYVLQHVDPSDGAGLLEHIPARLAARALARLDDRHGRSVAGYLSEQRFDDFVVQLNDTRVLRARISSWRPEAELVEHGHSETPSAFTGSRTMSASDVASLPALQGLARMLTQYPDLFAQWNRP
jgi:hypothetical protein